MKFDESVIVFDTETTGLTPEFDAHDSLEDVKATLFVAKKIYGED